MMKKTTTILAALALISGMFAPAAKAFSLNIELGDQPYYLHGGGYWSNGYYYVWVPGHWTSRNHHQVWVHGHYRVR